MLSTGFWIITSFSFVDGFNLVEGCNDAEQYRKVLEMIFDKLGQKQHYDMITIKKRD